VNKKTGSTRQLCSRHPDDADELMVQILLAPGKAVFALFCVTLLMGS
jgi:hypothetical protein